jgi:hypothetical protein
LANRSTFNSVLPRADKRLLALTHLKDAHEDRALRELFMEAHAAFKRAKNSSIRRSDVGVARGSDQDDATSS